MTEKERKDEILEIGDEVAEYVLDDARPALPASPVVRFDEFASLADPEPGEDDLLEIPVPGAPRILAEAGLIDDKKALNDEEADPVFAELAAPKLPELEKENRARLQMQSPNRLYFYWSVRRNPFQTLQKVFGGRTGNYRLVLKLVNQTSGSEQMMPVEAEGTWWFNVESDASYRAEIGFYAPNRPYFRVIFSNTVETPRKSPSPRAATEADWAITATEFAEVLDSSGFTRDAFEVALAGDDADRADAATSGAFVSLFGEDRGGFNPDEVRFALLALASGASVESLRGQIGDALFVFLTENAGRLSAESAFGALSEHFEISEEETIEEEFTGEAVFGASLVNFPRGLRRRTVPKTLVTKGGTPARSPRLVPVSSSTFGR